MDDNQNLNSGGGDNMDPTKELYEQLIQKVYKYKLEEREMALDRYRRADEQMDTAESFILMGKNAISFLKQASDSSDSIASLAKEIKTIVYKEGADSSIDVNFNDLDKRAIIDAVKKDSGEDVDDIDDVDTDLTDSDAQDKYEE